MVLSKSKEDYLIAIFLLKRQKGIVYSVDIAEVLQLSKPSVSVALKKLLSEAFITFGEDKNVQLTEKGQAAAESVFKRYEAFLQLLLALGVSAEAADGDAKRIGHLLSSESYQKIKAFLAER